MSEGCSFCISQRPKQRSEPLQTTPLPDRPWQRVAADLCEHKNQQFLVVVDYYSRYLEIAHLPKTRSTDVIAKLKCIFARFGVPEVLVTDNGPQFSSSEFRCFSQRYDFTHSTSSPHFPQSNGEAERAVQTAKRILKQDDPFLALMSYRAAASDTTGYSPAQLLMGRPIRTCLPSLPGNLMPAWPNPDEVRVTDNKTKKSYAKFYNNRHGAKPLHPLNPGDQVLLKLDHQKGWNTEGKVLEKLSSPCSYTVETSGTGSVVCQNRCHIFLPDTPSIPDTSSTDDPGLDPEQTPEPDTHLEPETKTRFGRVVHLPARYQDYVM